MLSLNDLMFNHYEQKAGLALYLLEIGDIKYICQAKPGVSLDENKWRVRKYDSNTGIMTWAEGSNEFIHQASNPETLNYFDIT